MELYIGCVSNRSQSLWSINEAVMQLKTEIRRGHKRLRPADTGLITNQATVTFMCAGSGSEELHVQLYLFFSFFYIFFKQKKNPEAFTNWFWRQSSC